MIQKVFFIIVALIVVQQKYYHFTHLHPIIYVTIAGMIGVYAAITLLANYFAGNIEEANGNSRGQNALTPWGAINRIIIEHRNSHNVIDTDTTLFDKLLIAGFAHLGLYGISIIAITKMFDLYKGVFVSEQASHFQAIIQMLIGVSFVASLIFILATKALRKN
jgi:hypothetical protein